MTRERITLAGVPLLAALASIAVMLASDQPGSRPADAVGAGLLVLAALPLLARRRHPVAAVAAVVAVASGYLVLDYPGGAELPVFMVAFHGAAVAGHRAWAAGFVGFVAVSGAAYRLGVERQNVVSVAVTTTLLVLVLLLGDATYARRRLRDEVQERLRAAAAEQRLETDRRLTAERLGIARELHDVLAHTITTLNVQAGVAGDLLATRPEEAREVLRGARAAARDAMTELRATITLLRDGEEAHPRGPAPGLGQLGELVRRTEAAGVQVDLDVAEVPRLPPAIDLTAYRVIQESLTNVVRHARADRVRVTVDRGRTGLTVTVEDDGRGGDGRASDGYGLAGLRERVHALGGELSAGPRADGGFAVRATLPLTEAPS